MKNKTIKIAILGIGIAMAIAGVLVFLPTIYTPPTSVSVCNVHISSLEENIKSLSKEEVAKYNDSIYYLVVDKIAMYRGESLMTPSEIDDQAASLVHTYVPVFVSWCDNKFSASKWSGSDHKVMLKQIQHLRTIKVNNEKTKVISGVLNEELKRVEGIIGDYKKARHVSKYTTFETIDKAKAYIEKAEQYVNQTPLLNCKDLVDNLKSVKINLGNSHYRQIENKVGEMAYYKNMSMFEFNGLISSVNEMINEYNEHRAIYGPNAKETDPLTNQASEYYREALEFFEREEIYFYTCSQWTSMSTDSSYRAFCSYSNYNVNNSDATMHFTIKGYESFSFYIRSNGESDYDYVMVGYLNSEPSENSNYANTKGQSSSGSHISNYKKVTFNHLDRSSTYTIYVTYHKDGSNHYGSDRGYILIPYNNW